MADPSEVIETTADMIERTKKLLELTDERLRVSRRQLEQSRRLMERVAEFEHALKRRSMAYHAATPDQPQGRPVRVLHH